MGVRWLAASYRGGNPKPVVALAARGDAERSSQYRVLSTEYLVIA
jgi:hypothetical protein